MRTATLRSIAAAAGLVALSAAAAGAQSLAQRIAGVRDGDVRLSFAVRPDVCGRGQSISRTGSRDNTSTMNRGADRRGDVDYDIDCDAGPGRLVVSRREGETVDLRFYVGGRWHTPTSATDLGTVGAREVADFLTGFASSSDGAAGRKAIFPATLVDSVVIWPSLMRLARDEHRPRETRKQAVFWLGQLAEGPATAGLDSLVGANDLDREVRKQAIFALSQRPGKEGIPALIQVVRTNRDPELRRQALFWLGQSNDPRALDLIEELLNKK